MHWVHCDASNFHHCVEAVGTYNEQC